MVAMKTAYLCNVRYPDCHKEEFNPHTSFSKEACSLSLGPKIPNYAGSIINAKLQLRKPTSKRLAILQKYMKYFATATILIG